MNENDTLNEELSKVFDPVEGELEPSGSSLGRKLGIVFLFGIPAVLLSTAFLFLSGKWGNDFRSRVAPTLASQTSSGEVVAPALSPTEIEILKERVSNTIRRDVTEKLKASQILGVSVDSLEANPDGSMDLEFTASYTEDEQDRKPASRAVTSKLKLEKKGPEWHVTSISPQDSLLIIEDEELIQSARKAAGL